MGQHRCGLVGECHNPVCSSLNANLGISAKPLDRAQALLEEFPGSWEIETQPAERRKLLLSLFEQIWAQNGQIVAVQAHDDFLPYFQPHSSSFNTNRHRVVLKAGATGVKPSFVASPIEIRL